MTENNRKALERVKVVAEAHQKLLSYWKLIIANNYTSNYDINKCFQLSNDTRAINFYFVDSVNISYYQKGDYFIKAIYGIKL